MTRRRKILGASIAIVIAWLALRFNCGKTVRLRLPERPGHGTHQITLSGWGFMSRCELTYPASDLELKNCIGDRTYAEFRLDGTLTGILIPCTALFPRLRFATGEKVLFDGPVTAECGGFYFW